MHPMSETTQSTLQLETIPLLSRFTQVSYIYHLMALAKDSCRQICKVMFLFVF